MALKRALDITLHTSSCAGPLGGAGDAEHRMLPDLYAEGWVQVLEAQQGRPAARCHKTQEGLLLIWCEAFHRLQSCTPLLNMQLWIRR